VVLEPPRPGVVTAFELKAMAKQFLVDHAAKITVIDVLAFMAKVKRDHIPLVLSTWREHGLSSTFLLEVATRLITEHQEPFKEG
jgi:hypothetical protein